MDFAIEHELQPLLSSNEKLLWTGRPKSGIVFQSRDLFLIPFSILWLGFAIFWEYNALKAAGGFFGLFGLPFIVIGLYFMVGRFFADALKRKNTIYGITDNRVIIKSGIFKRSIQSINIRTISNLTFKEKADGTGTITLGPTDFRNNMFSGMNTWPGTAQTPAIELIEQVRTVYDILIGQQRK